MNFKEWLKLKESGTSTSSVATVPMRLFSGVVRRSFPKVRKKKRKHKKVSLPGQINYLTFNKS
jgi:hypothetical protein